MTNELRTPVLIIGAGPVGTTLAIDLAWRGVPSLIIEQTDGTIEHPRVGLISMRSMELFRRWNFADRVRNCGFPEDYELSIAFCTSLGGWLLEKDPYPSMKAMETPPYTPEKKQRCPQSWLDPILKGVAAERTESTLRFRTRLDGFVQDADGVTAQATDLSTGETLTIRADYMVGCDGASSFVRNELGIEMKGNPKLNYSMSILLRAPGLLSHFPDKGEAERYLLIGPEGTWGNLTVIDGRDEWRLTVFGSEEKFDTATFRPEEWIRRALGRDDITFEILSMLPWRRTELIAESYGHGRVWLAGDAAHTMSPTGGMGVNTGIGDVDGLGWRLEAMLAGWGNPALLESYGTERQPVARRNAAVSTHNYKLWTAPKNTAGILNDDEAGEALRAEVGRSLLLSTQSDWQSWGLQLGYRYEGSTAIVPDGTQEPPDSYSEYTPTARPGHRAPHAWLGDGLSTLDLFGRGFALLAFPGADEGMIAGFEAEAEAAGMPLTTHRIADPEIAALYERPIVLVRPDGHVAWRGSEGAATEILAKLRGAIVSAEVAA